MRLMTKINLHEMVAIADANVFPSLQLESIQGGDHSFIVRLDAGHPAMRDMTERKFMLRRCQEIREWLDRLEEELRRSVDTGEPSR